ncbi:MAG: putative LPS assembly protein LptD [Bacteroidales bacterium]
MPVGNKIYIFTIAFVITLLLFNIHAESQHKRTTVPRIPSAGDTILPSLKESSLLRSESLPVKDIANITPDTIAVVPDTIIGALINDTVKADSITGSLPPKDSPLTDIVKYTAKDSVVFSQGNIAYMFGDGKVNYQETQLDADVIKMALDSSTVYAVGRQDTSGEVVGNPIFKDPSGEYESETMKYNFKSKKGYITNVVTQQGEGYLVGGRTKKNADGDFYLCEGKYTTCDNHDHPHFYMQLTRAKMRPGKNVVTGPAYMVIGGVPLPLAVPFGFFPFSSKYSSGVIMPTFGEESSRGFYLRNGGYYFAINDRIDLALTGEIYTKGSWGLQAQSAYLKRYKFSGYLNASYLVTILGDKGMPDYEKQTNFRLVWQHRQDQKANPNLAFSASVNFTTSGYDRNSLNTYYNASEFTQNTKSSTVNLTYTFPNAPVSLSTTANIAQRSKDSTLAVSFPDLTVSVNRIYPFKRKKPVGKERWYERISFNYTGILRNTITTKQNYFFKASLLKDWQNGMQHTIPISATFSLFKYINITPSFTFTDRMYTNRIMKQWDPQASAVVNDTLYGFYNVYNYSGSVTLQTKLYGFFQPLKWMGGKKIKMIRHVLTPSVSINAAPDFSASRFGFWQRYTQINNDGSVREVKYSPFSSGIFGTAPQGKQGSISFSLANNIEMKVNSDKDSTGVKKISLIENLSASWAYNAAADSMKWSNINMGVLIRLFKNFNLQASFTFDTYTYQLNSYGNPVRVNIPRWKAGKGLGRLSSTGTSFSYTFNNSTFQKLFKKDKDKKEETNSNTRSTGEPIVDLEELAAVQAEMKAKAKENGGEDAGPEMKNGYMVWKIPWSLSVNYSINYGYGTFNKEKLEYNGKITQNLSFSGNIQPTKNWIFTFSTSYDFDAKKLAYMSCGITRDLHCWSMSCDFVPVGPYQSYNFHISVKSSLLKDLKYEKSSSPYNKENWY